MINAGNANLVNSVAMIGLAFWAYSDDEASIFAILILLGVMLMVISQGVRAESVTLSKVSVVLTTIALISAVWILCQFGSKWILATQLKTMTIIALNMVTLILFGQFFRKRKARRKLIAQRELNAKK